MTLLPANGPLEFMETIMFVYESYTATDEIKSKQMTDSWLNGGGG
jgi:hypothetical protein